MQYIVLIVAVAAAAVYAFVENPKAAELARLVFFAAVLVGLSKL